MFRCLDFSVVHVCTFLKTAFILVHVHSLFFTFHQKWNDRLSMCQVEVLKDLTKPPKNKISALHGLVVYQ